MSHPVESFCNTLARSRLLSPEQIRTLRQRWLETAGPAAQDLPRFQQWLVATKMLTEFQLGALQRNNAEQLFLGPYRIIDRIGKGRMAGVYRARHELGSTVAIKVLPSSKAKDPQTLARFQREARLAVRLRHPNIVRTFQAGKAGALHYLVMEHLDGEPLDELLARRGPLPPAEAVRLVHQALMGLEQIHEQGLVHRDLKPGNLMVVGGRPESTSEATVKILDIGLGKALFDETAGSGDAELTNEGDVIGTPEYMAPEQARDARTADIRADIYSLGCVLYHCLAGRPPFTDANRVRIIVRHATEAPRPVTELNPAVPEGLQQILDWMLAKDPAGRYPTPQRAAQALQMFLAVGSAPAASVEQDPSLSAYLGWLDAQPQEEIPIVDVEPVSPPPSPRPAVPVAPVAAPVAAPVPPRVEVAPPVAKPAGKPARATPEDTTLLGLSRRDFTMLAIGVGGLAVAVSFGMAGYAVIGAIRRRNAPPPDENPPPPSEE